MRSVADHLRIERAHMVAQLTAAERVALALRLGEEDLALHQLAHGSTEHHSRTALRRARAIGRTPSSSNDAASR